ncbi:MAG: ribonuclease P protein component [Pseudomonadota bacterium]
MTDAASRPPRLLKRREFLAAARARKWSTPGFVLQARQRKPEEIEGANPPAARVGFTASKKVGNAVARNRAKRRLRALADEMTPSLGRHGWDYVLIARAETTASLPFLRLKADLVKAFERVHSNRSSNQQRQPRKEKRPS